MDRETLIKDWVAALRSGQYKQTTGFMRTSEGYDPFGVLCDVFDPNGWTLYPAEDMAENLKGKKVYQFKAREDNAGSTWMITQAICRKLQLDPEVERDLVMLNDRHRYSFDYIADYIERTLLNGKE